ncbi:MAG: Crp/Fnr family transcriptional regulator, partial [Bacteroidota bacterium]|nr:Crp/Fnr family transcriptional regulator [Bacteroidota bacterium]MDX5429886.1 Crp/Fnr family transcriptional regulator [Bacteroidota bacterium]MDX5468660.1 Crp/Fnr family transcriptional regulator [Bacteroidota bacterium]
KQLLRDFLKGFKVLSEEEIEALSSSMHVQAFPRHARIVKQGEVCQLCYFVLKGCLRQFHLNEEAEEKTLALYTEGQAINYYTSRTEMRASENTLECLEDCVLLVGDPEKDESFYSQYPALADITRQMLEKELSEAQSSYAKFVSASPLERYQNLLRDRPGLVQRVPQYQLASYLGMTPESLSRIKRRLAESERS